MNLPTLSRRDLRLATGLVMFTYVSAHFVNHALGLYSVDVAEKGLRVAVAAWGSLPGTLALYGAAAIHVALALIAVYERRTLRMPPLQALRIMLGFGMPLLLIGHVVATRLAFERYGLASDYSRVVSALWLSDGEGRQLALLAPGWLHGCLGLDFAFGRRALYQRLRPVLFGVALLLPVLAALGFLSMGRELAVLATDPAWLESHAQEAAGAANRIALGNLRDGLLAAYFVLMALVLAAREIRSAIERRSRSLVAISYPRRVVEVPRGWSVLEASRSFGIAHLSMCGGNARCSTCRVRVIEGIAHCPPASSAERRTLERIHAPGDVRLACQLRPLDDVAVLPLLDAESDLRHDREAVRAIAERDVALLYADLNGWTGSLQLQPSPHDTVYALNRFLAVVGDAVTESGGLRGHFDGDGATAIFGIGSELGAACRAAMQAAARIERELDHLNLRLAHEVGFRADFALCIHAGPAVIGNVGYSNDRTPYAIGETAKAARALREFARTRGQRFVLSRATLEAAAIAFDHAQWWAVAIDGTGATVDAYSAPSTKAVTEALPAA